MKSLTHTTSFILIATVLAACSTAQPYVYDDVYYHPNNDPIKKVQKDPREDFNQTDQISYDNRYQNRYQNEGEAGGVSQNYYRNRYTEAEQADNQQTSEQGNTTININNQNNGESDAYYDENYARTLNTLNSPVRSLNTYDPYVRDRIMFTQDPFFRRPNLLNTFNFWDPFGPRSGFNVGWNNWTGWNVGFNYGWGFNNAWGFNGGFGTPFYDPFWGWNNWNGFSPWNPWNRWNRFGAWGGGFGMNNYWASYNHGFVNGINQGGLFIGSGERNNGRRNTSVPRGNSGSTTYPRSGEATSRPNRGNVAPQRIKENQAEQYGTRGSRTGGTTNKQPSENTNRNVSPSNQRPTRVTPDKYRSNTTPESYTRQRPTRTNPEPRQNRPAINNSPSQRNSEPSYTRPPANRYNPSQQTQPQRNPRVQPQTRPSRQSRPTPSYNRSRPSYNNTPTYRPSGGSRSSGGSRPSRSTRSPR